MIDSHEDDIFYDGFGMKIWEKRHCLVSEILQSSNTKTVLDMGCNNGKLVQRLSRSVAFTKIDGIDICPEILHNETKQNARPETIQHDLASRRTQPLIVNIFQGNILKKHLQLKENAYDAIALIEVIEHLQVSDIPQLEANIFGYLQPKLAIVTTPNSDFNQFFNFKPGQQFRHDDHKFEWTQQEFRCWAQNVCEIYNYSIKEITGVGEHKNLGNRNGYCSQVCVFVKNAEDQAETAHNEEKQQIQNQFEQQLSQSAEKEDNNETQMNKQILISKKVAELEVGELVLVAKYDYPFQSLFECIQRKTDRAIQELLYESADYIREEDSKSGKSSDRYFITLEDLMNHAEIKSNNLIAGQYDRLIQIINSLQKYECLNNSERIEISDELEAMKQLKIAMKLTDKLTGNHATNQFDEHIENEEQLTEELIPNPLSQNDQKNKSDTSVISNEKNEHKNYLNQWDSIHSLPQAWLTQNNNEFQQVEEELIDY